MSDGLYTTYTVTFTYRPFGLLAVRDGRWSGRAWSHIDAFDRAVREYKALPEFTPLESIRGDVPSDDSVPFEMRYNPLFIARPKYRGHRVRLLVSPKVGQTVYYHVRPCGWGIIDRVDENGIVYASFEAGSVLRFSGEPRDFFAVFPVRPRRMPADDSAVLTPTKTR